MGYLIKGGIVITEKGEIPADVAIDNQRISAVGSDLVDSSERVTLDARGKYVLPGVIDAHTHFALRSRGTITADDFESGTKAAACGGVTTVIDFADQIPGMSLADAAKARIDEAKPYVATDFALHMTITKAPENPDSELRDLLESGVGAVKLFTTYRAAGYLLEKNDFIKVSKAAHRAGLLVTVHAEDNDLVENLESRMKAKGETAPAYHAVSRPGEAEASAIRNTASILGEAGLPVYFVHVSSGPGLEAVREARKKGYTVYAETSPHYLTLTSNLYAQDNAREFIMTPPLRDSCDIDALWNGVLNGEFDVIATDHCAFTRRQKAEGTSCFDTLPGIPGVETLLPLVHHEGVVRRGMRLSEIARMLSYNPAKLFGLYPRKGTITPGADADVVIFDPNLRKTITSDSQHSKAGYTPYEGMTVQGYPTTVLVRGKVVYDNGTFLGAQGSGRFIASKGRLSRG
ncbi:MAG: dihydropyrimidinase [Firmicutes bacterium]|nr:dihydropyrimidinase [Bacillota bacterium]HXL03594.1 dihydropyrimidinase [Bacillota bacterium]